MKAVTGNTFPVKEQLKALGGRWDGTKKCWNVPDEKFAAAMALVAGAGPRSYAPAPASPLSPNHKRSWRPCGYPDCKPGCCDECDGYGYRAGH